MLVVTSQVGLFDLTMSTQPVMLSVSYVCHLFTVYYFVKTLTIIICVLDKTALEH
jgi:hypothetical protein